MVHLDHFKSVEGRDWFHFRGAPDDWRDLDEWFTSTGINHRFLGGWEEMFHVYFCTSVEDAALIREKWAVTAADDEEPWSDVDHLYKPAKPRSDMSPEERLDDDIFNILREEIEREMAAQIAAQIAAETDHKPVSP